MTAVSYCIHGQFFEGANLLIEAGANVETGGGSHGTPLHIAIKSREFNQSIITQIVNRGVNVDVADEDGHSPLHYLMDRFTKTDSSHRAIGDMLLLAGAKPNMRSA